MPEKIGISSRMFYGYRSGAYPITAKAWRKLCELEKSLEVASTERIGRGVISDMESLYATPPDLRHGEPGARIEERMVILEASMKAMAAAVATLAETVKAEIESRRRGDPKS